MSQPHDPWRPGPGDQRPGPGDGHADPAGPQRPAGPYPPPPQPGWGQPHPYGPPQHWAPPAPGPQQAWGQPWGQGQPWGAPGGWPPPPPPVRRQRSWPWLLFALLLVVVAAAATVPLALRPTALDPVSVQRDVAAQYQQLRGGDVELRCDDDMPVEVDRTYRCSGTTADDARVDITIRVTGRDGAYTWSDGR
ncbi:DUF4333 domain-containing protein [Modestobacter sp. NPDC049651]|uniref:DUF4333 domain-containing protein n=1 Tax=unclassified Modestobacter TaxID=2643866 RepID=UPI0033E2DF7E